MIIGKKCRSSSINFITKDLKVFSCDDEFLKWRPWIRPTAVIDVSMSVLLNYYYAELMNYSGDKTVLFLLLSLSGTNQTKGRKRVTRHLVTYAQAAPPYDGGQSPRAVFTLAGRGRGHTTPASVGLPAACCDVPVSATQFCHWGRHVYSTMGNWDNWPPTVDG